VYPSSFLSSHRPLSSIFPSPQVQSSILKNLINPPLKFESHPALRHCGTAALRHCGTAVGKMVLSVLSGTKYFLFFTALRNNNEADMIE
jgi:hypothetical protein